MSARALALALCALWGCSLELPVGQELTPRVLCARDQDCAGALICEVGLCVAPDQPPRALSVQLSPPNTTDFVDNQYLNVTLRQGEPLPDLELERPWLMVGEVLLEGERAQPLAAQLLLRRVSGDIPGRTQRYQAQATRERGYSLQLPQGEFEIQLLPQRLDLPPQQLQRFPVRADLSQDFVLEAPSRSAQVQGRVVTLDPAGQPVPAARVRVTALAQRDDWRVSGLVETDEEGRFLLLVRSDVPQPRLLLEPQDPERALPQVLIEDIQLAGQQINLGDLSLGELSPPGSLASGQVRGDDGALIEGATILVEGQVGAGTLTRTVATSAEGYFEARLAAGSYTALIIPPEGSPFAITERRNLVVPAEGAATDFDRLQVGRKPAVTGLVVGPDGAPLGDAVVSLRATRLWAVRQLRAARTYTARTDALGALSLRAEPGLYDVEITPSPASGLPRAWRRGVEVEDTGTALRLEVPAPRVAYGVVTSPEGAPMADVQVDLIEVTPQGEAVLLGQGLTNPEGIYRVLIPAEP
jgi:hypothetical protein